MKRLIIFFIATLVLFSTVSACWGWLIYYKPAFRGKVIDAETKTPIEEAVVVVLYWKEYLVGGPGGPRSTILKAKETLTDSNGEFYFPSYNSIIPFSREEFASFIIYKPGYIKSSAPWGLDGPMTEKFFSIDVIGKESEIRDGQNHWKGVLGVVELTKGDGMSPSPPADYRSKALPLLFNAINEDRKRRGLEGEIK